VFYSVSVISYVKKVRQPFLMPLVIRGKQKTKTKAATGTRKYAAMTKQFWEWYRLTIRKKVGEEWIERQTWLEVCVYCKNLNGQRKQHRRQSFALSILMRNCWLEFERKVLLADGKKKQMTSEYVSFKHLLGIIRRTLENCDCHFSPANCSKTP
jgi:hypothetical protein